MRFTPLAIIAFLACDRAPTEPLASTSWVSNYSAECSLALDFNASGGYVLERICAAGDAFDMERQAGAYQATDGQLSRMPASSTCASAAASTVSYVLDGDRLTVDQDEFQATEADPAMGAARAGCLAADGTFSPSP